ncbi:MAG: BadF/BadG/BcrA/BcrD ATPase family protein, partial [Desulfobacteraceae bacterium]|nr:BadF/BadG/BcrA/BcrD ATPase family protein [Desulfobacteraceae bacterium]
MSIAGGCDVGSATTKVVIMTHRRILGSAIVKSRPKPAESAQAAMQEALAAAGIAMGDIDCCIGTGYGREKISFVQDVKSEVSCHGKGALWLLPSAKTVIDIGG